MPTMPARWAPTRRRSRRTESWPAPPSTAPTPGRRGSTAGWRGRTGTFTPQEAVRKLTGLPAGRLALADRGVLREGARADLAIFDPETFGETGTTFEPNSVARGMQHVVVNGVVTLRDGRLTGARGGQVLRSNG